MVGARRAENGASRRLVGDELLGKTLGGYRIEGLLGRGNRASVYRASSGGKGVAVRVFDRDLSEDPDFSARFRAQGALLATLRHPHLLPNSGYDFGEGYAFIVRPYVAGRTLRTMLVEALPLTEVVRLLQPVASALDFVHQRGLVHGDLKPGNILLPYDGPTMLVDLGAAQLLPRGNSLLMAATGRYYGTPEYLSPEQAHGLPLDGRTDGYALAIILYEALTGRVPFRAERPDDTPRTVAARHITATPPRPRTLNPALAETVEAVLLRALDKDPERRFASCLGLLNALSEAEAGVRAPLALPLAPTVMRARTATPEPITQPIVPPIARRVPAAPAVPPVAPLPPATDTAIAQHAADLQTLAKTYEARLATDAETLRERELTVETLSEELVAARERIAELTGQVAELEALLRDHEVMAARLRELELAARAARPVTAPVSDTAVASPTATLTVMEPERFGLPPRARFTVAVDTTIGRHPESTIRLNDHFVSGRHARIDHDEAGWSVTDLGATNGTFVNGERISGTVPIVSGDLLRFGRIQMTFR
jgi:hypothetical protein